MRYAFFAACFGWLGSLSAPLQAATIATGMTFSVASEFDTRLGTHFHSHPTGEFGARPGVAEIGSFFREEVRGMTEFDLGGIAAGAPIMLEFDVLALSGLYAGLNDFAYLGRIGLTGYSADLVAGVTDYDMPLGEALAVFDSRLLAAGQSLGFDVTGAVEQALDAGHPGLGIRFGILDAPNGGAITLGNMRLVRQPPQVPLPPGLALLIGGLGGLALLRRRRAG